MNLLRVEEFPSFFSKQNGSSRFFKKGNLKKCLSSSVHTSIHPLRVDDISLKESKYPLCPFTVSSVHPVRFPRITLSNIGMTVSFVCIVEQFSNHNFQQGPPFDSKARVGVWTDIRNPQSHRLLLGKRIKHCSHALC